MTRHAAAGAILLGFLAQYGAGQDPSLTELEIAASNPWVDRSAIHLQTADLGVMWGGVPAAGVALQQGGKKLRRAPVVVLLSSFLTDSKSAAQRKAAAANFLKSLSMEDPVAVYVMGWQDDFHIVRDFGTKGESTDILEIVEPEGSVADRLKALDVWPDRNPHVKTILRLGDAEEQTLGILEAIGNHLADVPGRKSLIWFCPNESISTTVPPIDSRHRPSWLSAMEALEKSRVAVYIVDDSHAPAVSAWNPPPFGQVETGFGRITPPLPPSVNHFRKPKKSFPELLSEFTGFAGGRYYEGMSKLKLAVEEAEADSRSSYRMAVSHPLSSAPVTPVHIEAPGTNLDLRYWHAHFSPPEMQAEPDRLRAAERALMTPLDAKAILCAIRVIARDTDHLGTVSFDANNIRLTTKGGSLTGGLDIIYAFYDSEGKRVGSLRDEVNLRVKVNELAAFLAKSHSIAHPLSLPAGVRSVRVVLRDRATGALGSAKTNVRARG